MSWSTSSNAVPAATLGSGSSVVFSDAWDDAALYGEQREPDADSPYTWDGARQIWYGDEDSVRDRIGYVRDDTDLAGIGFWALHYDGDDPAFWDMVHQETRSAAGTTPTTSTTTTPSTTSSTPSTDTTSTGGTGGTGGGGGGFVADAGRPFLAYVDDTVILSGKGSTGPDGVTLQYRWTQLAGPPVQLSSGTAQEPAFTVAFPGTYEFELLVGDGSTWSEPATSYLVAIDPDLPNRHDGGCACDQSPVSAGWGAALALISALGRRRRSAVARGVTGV
jgi:hypothetical protein